MRGCIVWLLGSIDERLGGGSGMKGSMAEIRRTLPRTRCDLDRHGNERWYAIDPYGQKVRLNPKSLHIEIGSDAFIARYRLAIAGDLSKSKPSSSKLVPGSIGELINLFLHDKTSTYHTKLSARSQYVLKGRLLALQKEHGHRSAEGLTVEAIEAGREFRKAKPWSANNRILTLRAVYKYGVKIKFVTHNPAAKVEKVRTKSEGYHTWTQDEIEQYQAHWPIGTMARLAFELLHCTGQRRSDVIRLGRQHITSESRLKISQRKTGAKLEIPIIPILADCMAACQHTHLTFIVTESGKPFTDNGFGNKFRDWCNAAGLPHCSAHGLRKALATQLAELGMTPNEIAAITGHKTLREVQRYTHAADQKRMADKAMRTFGDQFVPLSASHLSQVGGITKKD